MLQKLVPKNEINVDDFDDFGLSDKFKQYCIGNMGTYDIDKLAKNRLLYLLMAAGLCENDYIEECLEECCDDQLLRYEEA